MRAICSDFEGVGEAAAEVVARRVAGQAGEDLGFAGEAAKGAGVQDAADVAHERRAIRMGRLSNRCAGRAGRRGVRPHRDGDGGGKRERGGDVSVSDFMDGASFRVIRSGNTARSRVELCWTGRGNRSTLPGTFGKGWRTTRDAEQWTHPMSSPGNNTEGSITYGGFHYAIGQETRCICAVAHASAAHELRAAFTIGSLLSGCGECEFVVLEDGDLGIQCGGGALQGDGEDCGTG